MNGYIAFYRGNQKEVFADSIWQAKQKAIAELSVPKKKQGLLSVMLAEVEGNQVSHNSSSI
jgi:hypothetical protein